MYCLKRINGQTNAFHAESDDITLLYLVVPYHHGDRGQERNRPNNLTFWSPSIAEYKSHYGTFLSDKKIGRIISIQPQNG